MEVFSGGEIGFNSKYNLERWGFKRRSRVGMCGVTGQKLLREEIPGV